MSDDDFIAKYLNLTPDQINKDPVAKALSDTVKKYAADYKADPNNGGNDLDFKKLRDFFENPQTLAGDEKKTHEEEIKKRTKEIGKIDAKIKVLEASIRSVDSSKKGGGNTNPSSTSADRDKLAEDLGNLTSDKIEKTEEIENRKKQIENISARSKSMGSRRKDMTLKAKLDTLNFYFVAKDAIKRSEAIDFNDVTKKSRAALEKAEEEHLKKVIKPKSGWEEFWDSYKPDLKRTLKGLIHKDKVLKVVADDSIDHLLEHPDNTSDVQHWLKGIPVHVADTIPADKKDEEKEKQQHEVILPVLLAHLNGMLNVGGRARLNKDSIETTKKLIIQLGKIEWGYQVKKGKEKDGDAIEKMIVYSNFQNGADAQRGKADKHIAEKLEKIGKLRGYGKTAKKAIFGTAFALTTLWSPIAATIGVGGALAALYTVKGDKSPKEIKKDKIKSGLLAVGSAVTAGGMYLAGLSAMPVLGLAAGAGVISYGYSKSKKTLKKWKDNFKEVAKGFI